MPDLSFQVEGAEPVRSAASPLLALKLRVINREEQEHVHTIVLRCQVQIEPARRRYTAGEQERLFDLFDTPERWGQTVHSLLWANTSVIVPPFTGCTVVDVQLPCTLDLNAAATKYFAGLETGDILLLLLFNGTVFYKAEDGALQVAPIPWDKDARYRMTVQVWQQMMDYHYPNSVWLSLRKDIFERLDEYKSSRGAGSWEEALERLLHEPNTSAAGASAAGARNGR